MTTAVLSTRVTHARGEPITHVFRHASTAWLVDVGALGPRTWPTDRPAALGRLLSFRADDHLGDAESTWYDNVLTFARTHGVDLRGHRVVALTTARALGHAFNPLTVYWCHDAGAVRCVIAEVHNTYGERHAYLVEPDARDRAETGKSLYVSPFNDLSGRYRMSVPFPVGGVVDVRISLHRNGSAPFVASWHGREAHGVGAVLAVARSLFTPRAVAGLIRLHGVWLWARRLPIVPRPHQTPQESV